MQSDQDQQPFSRVLMLGTLWPKLGATAAFTRVLSIVTALIQAGHQVTYAADERENEGTTHLRALGVECLRLAPNDSSFDLWVLGARPNIAIMDRYATEEKFGWRLRAACPSCIRVLDSIDLHCLRIARGRAIGTTVDGLTAVARLASDVLHREVAAIYRSDLTLVVSDFEWNFLVGECGVPATLLHLCRLSYPPRYQVVREFAGRSDFCTIGNFRHPPNADSVDWLRREIWPELRSRLPEARLHVYGANATKDQLAWNRPDQGFLVHGWVADQFDALATHRVSLAPLRYGAGIKGKIADSWWVGTPVVSTTVGAEGMHEALAFGGLVADSVEPFVEAAVTLYSDAEGWGYASRCGQAVLDRFYSHEVTLSPLLDKLMSAPELWEAQRLRNLCGEILWSQSHRATEYLSRWIEAKRRAGRLDSSPRVAPSAEPGPSWKDKAQD